MLGRARQKLNAPLASKLGTARAWDLKETFRHFWCYKSVTWAGAFLDYRCYRAMRSRLEPMKKIARMLRAHEPLILNWFRAKGEISSGAVEGLNNKIRVVTRRSYGFRTYDAMEIALYHNLIRKVSSEGTTSTIAGNGVVGYIGEGNPATVAELSAPRGLAVDASGDIMIADSGNNAIRKLRVNNQSVLGIRSPLGDAAIRSRPLSITVAGWRGPVLLRRSHASDTLSSITYVPSHTAPCHTSPGSGDVGPSVPASAYRTAYGTAYRTNPMF